MELQRGWPVEVRDQTSATSVTLHPLTQGVCGCTRKRTVEKSQTNATSVTMHPLIQAL